jgi:hypothetical protein
LDFIGFSSEQLLKHGNKRVVYCVPLAKNFREVLIGYEKKPKYYFPQNKVKLRTKQLADYWHKRWLLNRIKEEKFLAEVEKHTLDYPIKHGARVPQIEEEELTLFNQ